MKLNNRFLLITASALLLFFSVKYSLSNLGKGHKHLPDYMATIKENFDKGLFKRPLQKGHDLYKETLKKWGFNQDLSRRKAISEASKNKIIVPTTEEKSELFILSHKEAILELCKQYPNDPLAKELKASLHFVPSDEQKASIEYIASLKHKFQGDGHSPLENQLIRIDTEYWLKTLALTSQLAKGDWSLADFREHMIVLEMDKIKQMQIACNDTEFPNEQIQKHVDTVAHITPELQAMHWANASVKELSKKPNSEMSAFEQSLANFS